MTEFLRNWDSREFGIYRLGRNVNKNNKVYLVVWSEDKLSAFRITIYSATGPDPLITG